MAEFETASAPEETRTPINFKWEPTDKFILTGIEFEVIYNGLRAQTQDPVFQRALHTIKALEAAEGIFRQGIEAGVIKPIYPETEDKRGWQDTDLKVID